MIDFDSEYVQLEGPVATKTIITPEKISGRWRAQYVVSPASTIVTHTPSFNLPRTPSIKVRLLRISLLILSRLPESSNIFRAGGVAVLVAPPVGHGD